MATIIGTNNDDSLAPVTPGNDYIRGLDGNDYILGKDGSDKLYGDSGLDKIYSGIGNDYIDGGADNDLLYGDDGDDQIYGGTGGDQVRGGTGDDRVYGGDGADILHGDAGADVIYGDAGNDKIDGGEGNDAMRAGDGLDQFFFNNAMGDDRVWGGAAADTYNFGLNTDGTLRIEDFEFGLDKIVGVSNAELIAGHNDHAGGDTYVMDTGSGHSVVITFVGIDFDTMI